MFDALRQATLLATWFGVCAWAIARGRAPERYAGAVHLITAVLTPAVQYRVGENHIELGIFIIDLAVLAIFVFIALRWDRWWTIFAAAFLLCQALTHVVRLYNLDVHQFYYASTAMFWSFMSLWAMGFGVAQLELRRWKARSALRRGLT